MRALEPQVSADTNGQTASQAPALLTGPDPTGNRVSPWRVFHLIKGLGRGGAEILLLETLRASAKRSEYTYGYGYLLPHKDALAGALRETGATDVVCFDTPTPVQAVAAAAAIARHLRAWGADLLHCHLPLTGIVGRLAGRIARVPVVYTEHNLQERYHALTRWANGRTWGLQHFVLAVSREVADSIRRHHGDRVPVETLHNGVDSERFAADPEAGRRLRAELGLASAAPVVGTVAVLRRQKNLELWLEMARRVREHYRDAQFVVVGDGPLASELHAHAARIGLKTAVHWPGLQDDVRPYLAAMDVFVQTSTFEGLPVALLEAMAMERPVVATAVGGVAEAADETCARLVPPRAGSEELATEVTTLLADPALRESLGRAGRVRVVTSFSIERMLDELEAVYRRLLTARRGRRPESAGGSG